MWRPVRLQAGVASRREPGAPGNFVEQSDQLTPSSGIKSTDQLHLELVRSLPGAREQLPPHRGETNRVSSSVTRVRMAFDEPVLLEFVDKPNHGIAVDAHRVGQLLLGLTVGEGELAKDSELARVEP
jgi:hypothetical protein